MTTSENNIDPTSVQAWKRNQGVALPLPSGNAALIRRPGITTLLAEGVFPDNIVGIITDMINEKTGAGPKKPQDRKRKVTGEVDDNAEFMAKVAGDPEKLRAMMVALDRILALVCIQPPVTLHWTGDDPRTGKIPLSERRNDVVYTDDVDEGDKMAIFNFAVGGNGENASFRPAAESPVGDVSGSADVALSS